MSNKKTIKAQVRDKKEKVDRTKKIPAVIYGGDIKGSQMLWIDQVEFLQAYEELGESTILDLKYEVDGKEQVQPALIYDAQYHPLGTHFLHVDFFKVTMGEELETEVELEFIGESPAVKEKGGVFVKNMDAVAIRCLPRNLPGKIEVDISRIADFSDHICVKDLNMGAEVKVVNLDPETVVASVSAPRTQEELEGLNEEVDADVSQIKGIKKEEESTEAEGGEDKKKEDKKEEKKDN